MKRRRERGIYIYLFIRDIREGERRFGQGNGEEESERKREREGGGG